MHVSLKEWIKTHYGSQRKMDEAMGWSNQTAARFLHTAPHRFFEFRHEFQKKHGTTLYELSRMIDQREHELLVKSQLRQGEPNDAPLVSIPDRVD
jgi:hypothetical protein